MSNSTLVHGAGEAAPAADAGEALSARESGLAPEAVVALIARAGEVITGRVQPPPLPVPPEVEQFLQREFGEGGMYATPAALRMITERLCLDAIYRGQPVACVTTAAGTVAVVATGAAEIFPLLDGLSGEEAAKVVVEDTEWWTVTPVE